MAKFYTADLHFTHQAIIKHCARPFATFGEMDAVMLQNLRDAVRPKDDLYIVGDFAFGRGRKDVVRKLFEQIPGRKHLIGGNHDHEWVKKFSWTSQSELLTIQDGDTEFVACHYPMMTWNKARYGTKHLFGHIHDVWAGSDRALNVGVDFWDFKPVQKEAILARMSTLGQHPRCQDHTYPDDPLPN